MRVLALTAAAFAALTLTASANTLTWTDQAMRLVFTAPQDWTIDQRVGLGEHDTQTFVVIQGGGHLCQFNSDANWDTFPATPGTIHRQTREGISAAAWTAALNKFPEIFPNNSAQVTATSLDSSGFWPIQRAEARSERGTVLAAFQQRPGVDLITVCVVSDEAQRPIYEQVIDSVAHPSDGILQTSVEAELHNQASAGGSAP